MQVYNIDYQTNNHKLYSIQSKKQCQVTEQVPGDSLDNDCDGRIDEEVRDGKDNDGDGKIDEDLELVRAEIVW